MPRALLRQFASIEVNCSLGWSDNLLVVVFDHVELLRIIGPLAAYGSTCTKRLLKQRPHLLRRDDCCLGLRLMMVIGVVMVVEGTVRGGELG